MPRPRCSKCGAPSEDGLFRTKCEYCGAKLERTKSLRQYLGSAIIPLIALAGITAVVTRRFIDTPFTVTVEVIYIAFAIGAAFVLRNFSTPDRTPRILDFLKAEAHTARPVQYRVPEKPAFDAPRSWESIVSAPRPRKLKWTFAGKFGLAVILLIPGSLVWLSIIKLWNPRGGDHLYDVILASFFSLLMICVFIGTIRDLRLSGRLMRDGEVTVGWVADVWDAGGRHSRIHITVGFRDSVGRLFERDFIPLRINESIDQGRPVLVFYDPLNPECCVTSSASWIQLAEPVVTLSADRAG
jgi:hypothetical protein